jgi:hypothetical protein
VPQRGCEIRIPVVCGGRVRLLITKADGRLFGGLGSLVGSPGRFSCNSSSLDARDSENVPAGNYVLHVMLPGGEHEESVEIRPCAVTQVRIRLP